MIDGLIDYIVFYAVSALFRPYNGGWRVKTNIGVFLNVTGIDPLVLFFTNKVKIVSFSFLSLAIEQDSNGN